MAQPRQPSARERIAARRDGPAADPLTSAEVVEVVARVAPPPATSSTVRRLADAADPDAPIAGPPDPP